MKNIGTTENYTFKIIVSGPKTKCTWTNFLISVYNKSFY